MVLTDLLAEIKGPWGVILAFIDKLGVVRYLVYKRRACSNWGFRNCKPQLVICIYLKYNDGMGGDPLVMMISC